jgi:hypothetical protein
MHCEIRSNGDTSVISLSGRFVFQSHRSFREAYEPIFLSWPIKHCCKLSAGAG